MYREMRREDESLGFPDNTLAEVGSTPPPKSPSASQIDTDVDPTPDNVATSTNTLRSTDLSGASFVPERGLPLEGFESTFEADEPDHSRPKPPNPDEGTISHTEVELEHDMER